MKYLAVLSFLLFLLPGIAQAHKTNDSYLNVEVDGSVVHGRWDVGLWDMGTTARLDRKTLEDDAALRRFALEHLSILAQGKPCALRMDLAADQKEGEETWPPALHFIGECPEKINALTIDYSPVLVIDPQYGSFVEVVEKGQSHTSSLSSHNPFCTFKLSAPDRWQQFRDYLREGVWHIWTGYDHILFLLSLLLPAAFIVRDGAWQPREGFRNTFIQVLKVVTAFTVAHSVTLGLVIFGVVSLPSRLVESTIAASIAVAALNNLHPMLRDGLWMVAFCFGLIHGMGFASALQELGLPDNARWLALFGFNLGVEVGQVSIVAVALPVIYGLRHVDIYRRYIFRAASASIIAVALLWFTQRAFAVTLLKGMLGA